jgi:hypothetical protein
MKIKFVVVSALVGAMSSFGLNPALSAPSTEPTNLAALLKARQQNKSAEAEKPATAPKKASVVSRRAAPATKGSAGKRSQSKDTTARNAKGGAYSSIINRYASTYGCLPHWPMRLFVTRAISSRMCAAKPVKSA